jgi:hypothetical protein
MHPTRNEPYMKSHGGGRDNSPEGQQVARILFSLQCQGNPRIEERAANHCLLSLGSVHSRIYLRVSECRG